VSARGVVAVVLGVTLVLTGVGLVVWTLVTYL
jgi:hypothetical protein